jgi:uncharacterized iron-regulated protein
MIRKKIQLSILAALLLIGSAFRSDKPAYQLFRQGGKKVSYGKMLQAARKADIVLFGELHNNPISHWLQLELARDLFEHAGNRLVLGAEMLEADDQAVLNQYLQQQISEKELSAKARLWPNFHTDYKPLVDFARANQLPVIATNVPRRYASSVARSGVETLDTLGAEDKQWMVPLPFPVDLELPGYQNMIRMMHGEGSGHGGMNPVSMAKAQALKDATMAHFILQHWQPGKLFLHLNGAYHSNNFEGIVWYLRQQNPDLQILTVSSVETEDPATLAADERNLAHFILAIPATMTKTY